MRFVIEGFFCAAATPLKEDGTPDLPLFGAHARALLEEGCHGVALLGSTGEAASFGIRERMDLLEAALASVPGEDPHRGLVLFSLGELYVRNGHRSNAGKMFAEAVEFNGQHGNTILKGSNKHMPDGDISTICATAFGVGNSFENTFYRPAMPSASGYPIIVYMELRRQTFGG